MYIQTDLVEQQKALIEPLCRVQSITVATNMLNFKEVEEYEQVKEVREKIACVASVFVWFRSKERCRNDMEQDFWFWPHQKQNKSKLLLRRLGRKKRKQYIIFSPLPLLTSFFYPMTSPRVAISILPCLSQWSKMAAMAMQTSIFCPP